jgi:hypothetical protein
MRRSSPAGEPDKTLATLPPVGQKFAIAGRVLFLELGFAREQVARVLVAGGGSRASLRTRSKSG